jgi:hypothetical protein
LGEHIIHLEQKIEALKTEIHDPERTPAELRVVRIDLGIAERSLVHFRKAFELEQKISH